MREGLIVACALAIATGACASDSVTTPAVVGYTVALGTPSPASASVGSPLPIVFTVSENESDGSSHPAKGKNFTIVVTAGGGLSRVCHPPPL
jgi:hypothetical protein